MLSNRCRIDEAAHPSNQTHDYTLGSGSARRHETSSRGIVPRQSKGGDELSSKMSRQGNHSPTGKSLFPTFGRSKSRSGSSQSRGAPKRSVSFDKVQIREFQQILGDHPCPDDGPSLALGWNYNEKKQVKLDKYEAKRNGIGSYFGVNGSSKKTSKRRSLSPCARKDIALEWGYTREQIAENRKQNIKTNLQRRRTVMELCVP